MSWLLKKQTLVVLWLCVLWWLSYGYAAAFYTGMPASVVVGQPDFTSSAVNQGGSVAAITLNYPKMVTICQGKLIVSDQNNNRVLIWNSIPSSNNARPM